MLIALKTWMGILLILLAINFVIGSFKTPTTKSLPKKEFARIPLAQASRKAA